MLVTRSESDHKLLFIFPRRNNLMQNGFNVMSFASQASIRNFAMMYRILNRMNKAIRARHIKPSRGILFLSPMIRAACLPCLVEPWYWLDTQRRRLSTRPKLLLQRYSCVDENMLTGQRDGTCKLRFEGEEEIGKETDVERRLVLEV